MECHNWRWSGPELVTNFYVGSRSGFDLSQTTSGLLPGQGQMLMPDQGPFSTPDLASARHRSGWVVPGLAPVARNTWCLVWPGCEPDKIAIWVGYGVAIIWVRVVDSRQTIICTYAASEFYFPGYCNKRNKTLYTQISGVGLITAVQKASYAKAQHCM